MIPYKNYLSVAAILVMGAVLISCVKSDISSYTDPEAKYHSYSRMLVLAMDFPLDERRVAEQTLAAAVEEHGVVAIEGLTLIKPTREYSIEEAYEIVKNSGADSVLVLRTTDKGSVTTYSPERHTTTGSISPSIVGNYSYRSTTTSSGGQRRDHPTSKYVAELIYISDDISTSGTVWYAEIKSIGIYASSYRQVTEGASRKLVEKLKADGLIGKP